jgi:MFS family permease
MNRWKLNLAVLFFGQFFVMAGMSMVTPFLPYYLQEDLGVTDTHQVALWTSFIFSANFVTSFIFQPIWGKVADKRGRKLMLLRSGFGMSVCIGMMGFATSPWMLLFLRMLNGTISGFNPAAVSLLSTTVPRERMGFALGILQSGGVAGTILGPLMGGMMAEWVGYRQIFYITGSFLFLASLLALLFVKDNFDAAKAAKAPQISIIKGFLELTKIPQLPALYSVTILIQFALLSVMPLISLFVQELHGQGAMLAFYAGLVTSVTGFSNMAASPILGRLGDKIGSERILLLCLIGASLTTIPQAFVTHVWQLLAARFLFGMFMGGLLPSVNALIRKYTPDGMEGRAYSFNTSALSIGNLTGPIIGGTLSGLIHIQGIFILSACLFALNAVWVKKTLSRPAKRGEATP